MPFLALERKENCVNLLLNQTEGNKVFGKLDVNKNVKVKVDLKAIWLEGVEFSNPS